MDVSWRHSCAHSRLTFDTYGSFAHRSPLLVAYRAHGDVEEEKERWNCERAVNQRRPLAARPQREDVQDAVARNWSAGGVP